jgi:hypothetical protein
MLRGRFKSKDTKWNTQGESFFLLMIDAQERRLGQGKGLGTLSPLTVNDEWWLVSFKN